MNKDKLVLLLLVLAIILIFAKTSEAPLQPVLPTPHTDFREISTGDTSKKQIIITVDAGFGNRSAPGLLAALKKHKIKATFFLVGQWIESHPELTKQIAQEGHEIFNHSYDHRDYTTLTAEEIKIDLQKMDDVIYTAVGIRTRPYYRAPSGARNAEVNKAAAEAGFQHIYWDVDPQDWRLDVTGETIEKRVLDKVHPGAIVLLHIADSATGDIADDLFTKLKAQGYALVSLTEGL